MSDSRLVQVWFGIVGIAAGIAVMFSGVFASSEKAQAANEGISITIVRTAPSK